MIGIIAKINFKAAPVGSAGCRSCVRRYNDPVLTSSEPFIGDLSGSFMGGKSRKRKKENQYVEQFFHKHNITSKIVQGKEKNQ
jgi:hypothetical protein